MLHDEIVIGGSQLELKQTASYPKRSENAAPFYLSSD